MRSNWASSWIRAARKRFVVGVDIDIRAHNRAAMEAHPMSSRIHMIQGSSTAPEVVAQVQAKVGSGSASARQPRLEPYPRSCPSGTRGVRADGDAGSYCVVFDTIVEDLPATAYPDRPWGRGDNPKTAVWTYLQTHPEFEIDESIDDRLLISVAPHGFLRRKT